jgi:hypothetical protein
VQAEYARQRQYLERTLDGLKRKAQKEADLRQMDRAKMYRENAVLVEEVNNLRREVKLIQQEIACAEMGVEATLAAVQPKPPVLPKSTARSGTTPKASTTTTALATARNMSIGGVLVAAPEENTSRGTRSGVASAAITTRSHDGMLREAEMQRVTIAQVLTRSYSLTVVPGFTVLCAQLQARIEALKQQVTKEPLLGRAAADGDAPMLSLEDEVVLERRPDSRSRSLAPLAADPATE